MPSDLLVRLHKLISQLATRALLSVDDITAEFEADLRAAANQAAFSKAVLASAGLFRAKAQFGKLRASLLAGTALLGPPFLRRAERTGLLLSDNMPPAKYGRFLSALEREVSTSRNEPFRSMHERVTTYVAYTYMYLAELDEWLEHLASLGFERLPDEQRRVKFPLSLEEFRARLDEPREGGQTGRPAEGDVTAGGL